MSLVKYNSGVEQRSARQAHNLEVTAFESRPRNLWLYGIMAITLLSYGRNSGSIPGIASKNRLVVFQTAR